MRHFPQLRDAIPEIHRDIFKASKITSSRVQQFRKEATVHEALNYTYTIEAGGIPAEAKDILSLGLESGLFPDLERHAPSILQWMRSQLFERYATTPGEQVNVSDHEHPLLASTAEGDHFGYTYAERLYGAVDQMTAVLLNNPDTRRAYWPIYQPLDALRAGALTRIPCSLGYSLMIREVPGLGPKLHMTYLQRSSDFARFWLTDVYFAHRFQLEVLDSLQAQLDPNLQLGNFVHTILSFHIFDDGVKEVY